MYIVITLNYFISFILEFIFDISKLFYFDNCQSNEKINC